jgi:hypothetical protein
MVRELTAPTLDMRAFARGSFVKLSDDYGDPDYGVVLSMGHTDVDRRFELRIASFPDGNKRVVYRDVQKGEVRLISKDHALRFLGLQRDWLYELAHDIGGHEGIVVLRSQFELKRYIQQLNLCLDAAIAVETEPTGPCSGVYIIGVEYPRKINFLEGKFTVEQRTTEAGLMEILNKDLEANSEVLGLQSFPNSFLVYEVPIKGLNFLNGISRLRLTK